MRSAFHRNHSMPRGLRFGGHTDDTNAADDTNAEDAACPICLDSEPPLIAMGCACRGSMGKAHAACMAHTATEASKTKFAEAWTKCSTCKQPFMGAMRAELAAEWWRIVQHRAPTDAERQAAAHVYSAALISLSKDSERPNDMLREAETLLRQLVETESAGSGYESDLTLGTIVTLGNCLLKQKRYAESERVLRAAHEALTRVYGPHHATTLVAQETLGSALCDQPGEALGGSGAGAAAEAAETYKKLEEGERMLRGVLSARLRGGASELLVLQTKDILSMALARQKTKQKMDEAARMQHDVLVARKALLGKQHESTLATVRNVTFRHAYELLAATKSATSLSDSGKNAQATAELRDAVTKAVAVLGTDHASVISAKRTVCTFLARAGKPAEAEPIERDVLAAKKRTLGADHPHTLSSMFSLGECLFAQSSAQGTASTASTTSTAKKLDEAVAILEATLDACTRVLGAEHAHTVLAERTLRRARDARDARDAQHRRASKAPKASKASASTSAAVGVRALAEAEAKATVAEAELMAMLALDDASPRTKRGERAQESKRASQKKRGR